MRARILMECFSDRARISIQCTHLNKYVVNFVRRRRRNLAQRLNVGIKTQKCYKIERKKRWRMLQVYIQSGSS